MLYLGAQFFRQVDAEYAGDVPQVHCDEDDRPNFHMPPGAAILDGVPPDLENRWILYISWPPPYLKPSKFEN